MFNCANFADFRRQRYVRVHFDQVNPLSLR
jgi:hypothetical protein